MIALRQKVVARERRIQPTQHAVDREFHDAGIGTHFADDAGEQVHNAVDYRIGPVRSQRLRDGHLRIVESASERERRGRHVVDARRCVIEDVDFEIVGIKPDGRLCCSALESWLRIKRRGEVGVAVVDDVGLCIGPVEVRAARQGELVQVRLDQILACLDHRQERATNCFH